MPVRQEGDAIVRVLVGEGSPVELGTPGLILDVELPKGGAFSSPVPSDFNGFVYMLEGEASFGANRLRASRSQIAVLGPGRRSDRGRCAARDALHAHGREAVRRDARLQRTVRGLTADVAGDRTALPPRPRGGPDGGLRRERAVGSPGYGRRPRTRTSRTA